MRHALHVLLAAGSLAACTRARFEPPANARIDIDAAGPPADAQAPGIAPDAGESPFPARAAGGSRLKVLYGKTSDGEKYFLWSFYDTMWKIPCAFDLAQDGKRRCLPLPPQVSLPYSTDCTGGQPLFPADDACAGAYARMKIGGRLAIYKVSAALVPPRAVRNYGGPIPPPWTRAPATAASTTASRADSGRPRPRCGCGRPEVPSPWRARAAGGVRRDRARGPRHPAARPPHPPVGAGRGRRQQGALRLLRHELQPAL